MWLRFGSKSEQPALVVVARRWVERSLRGVIHAYRYLLSPLLGAHCRFYPSCSAYALEAIDVHGPLRGSMLATGRILRCHPWHPGGIDMVPPADPEPMREASQ